MRPRRRVTRSLAVAGAFALAGGVVAAVPTAAGPVPGEETVIDLYGINDFHGRIEADGQSAGAAVLSGAIQELGSENSLFVSAGDDIGASTFTSFIQEDEPTIDSLNAAGLAVSGAGNHEFDKGFNDLADRVRDRAEYEIISSNVFDEETGEPALTPYEIITVGGRDIAFVGAVTEDLPTLVSPSGLEGIEIRDIPESVNAAVEEIGDAADAVVLLLHEGPTGTSQDAVTSGELGRILDGVGDNVDAVFTGHTHLDFNYDLSGYGDLALPVVQTGQYGYNLGQVSLTFSADGELTDASSAIIPLTEEHVDDEGESVWNPLFPEDDDVAAIVAAAVEAAEELGAVSVGEITSDINRGVQSDGQENRGAESTLGNLVADMQLEAVQVTDPETQVAFMNPGGLRTDLTYASSGAQDPDGNVTYREAAEVQPFANTLVTTTLTGEQIVSVLEEQWQPAGASRPFLKLGVAGLTYTYDPTAAEGERISEVTLADGTSLDPSGEYRTVVNSFLASGGDDFGTLTEGADPRDTGQIDLEAAVSHFENAGAVSPDPAQRAVGVTWQTEGPYAAGDEVAFNLSSLLFTDDPATDATATVSVGEQVLAEVPVDATIVDATDEVGQASVSFTVPEDVVSAGVDPAAEVAAELTVAVPATGTSVTLPITFEDGTGDDTGTDAGAEDGADDGTEDGSDAGTDAGTEDGGTEAGTDTGTDTGTDDGEDLPDTGSSPLPWIIGAIVVLALGGGLYAWSRSRSSGSGPPSATPEA